VEATGPLLTSSAEGEVFPPLSGLVSSRTGILRVDCFEAPWISAWTLARA